MIDEKNKIIYIDHSTKAVLQACHEKCRLGNVKGYRLKEARASALDFGHAFHAAIAGYYDALAGGYHDADGKWYKFGPHHEPISPLNRAQAAFLRDLQFNDAQLPVSLESDERRSIERGLALIEAYLYRWRNEPYENLVNTDGSTMTEVGFRIYLTTFGDYEVWYVGYIDRLMRSMATGRPVIFETKTTTQGLSSYILQCKPNDQITGYFGPAQALFPDIKECVWDCVFISDRNSDMQKALMDRFWMYGIDVKKDFARQTTSRTSFDISEWRIDTEYWALEYCKWLTSGITRWPRTAPGACHAFGGCMFRNRCNMNLEDETEFMNSFYRIEKWEPWKKIVERLS
jgi:PD-(D/E)XK nuclease superfamily protein